MMNVRDAYDQIAALDRPYLQAAMLDYEANTEAKEDEPGEYTTGFEHFESSEPPSEYEAMEVEQEHAEGEARVDKIMNIIKPYSDAQKAAHDAVLGFILEESRKRPIEEFLKPHEEHTAWVDSLELPPALEARILCMIKDSRAKQLEVLKALRTYLGED